MSDPPAEVQHQVDRVNGSLALHHDSLKVLVVGAGIAGLTAAITLRKNGHKVQVYEQSQLASETGQAIHISPNANSTLRRLGVNQEEKGGIKLLQTRYFDSSCNLLSIHNNEAQSHIWQEAWLQAHRSLLHEQLLDVATDPKHEGTPVIVHTSSRVTTLDCQKGTITFDNGQTITGDVLVGADGVRSVCRKAMAGREYDSFEFGKNAFRFMVTREALLNDPETREFGEILGSLDMFFGPEHKFIMYPCINNEWMSITCIHPSHQSSASSDSTYNTSVSKDTVLKVFAGFSPKILRIIEKCDKDSLKVWPLFDAPDLPTFVEGRLALIGDAAHAFTPFIGQGAAMAIEDADSLGVMLSNGLRAFEVPERLRLYNAARHERATLIKGYSRVAGGDGVKEGDEANTRMKGREHALYAVSHDEYHHSSQVLREHLWSKSETSCATWPSLAVFGPISGLDPLKRVTVTTARIVFKTSATLLRTLFPSKAYNFTLPDTVASASLVVHSYRDVHWLGGQGFHQVRLEVQGVQYTTRQLKSIPGRYIPVAFENSSDSIVHSREKLRYPSVFSDIDIVDFRTGTSKVITLSWKGIKWASIWFNDLQPSKSLESNDVASNCIVDGDVLVHSSDSSVRGESDITHVIREDFKYDNRITCNGTTHGVTEINNINKGSISTRHAGFEFIPQDPLKLPTLQHIVLRLAEIPIFKVVNATLEEGVLEDISHTDVL